MTHAELRGGGISFVTTEAPGPKSAVVEVEKLPDGFLRIWSLTSSCAVVGVDFRPGLAVGWDADGSPCEVWP